MSTAICLTIEDPRADPDVVALLEERSAHSHALYPPESVHVLDLDELAGPDVAFWTLRVDGAVAGSGALLLTGNGTAEVKSMFVRPAYRGRGLSALILAAIEAEAVRRGVAHLRLETGHDAEAAQALYRSAGFTVCAPFPPYRPDPLSVFMEKRLD